LQLALVNYTITLKALWEERQLKFGDEAKSE
jgi:hypothetical protein